MIDGSLTIIVSDSLVKISPPGDRGELLARAADLAGLRVDEVASRLGIVFPDDPRRTKGAVGELVEAALGASAGNLDLPDFPELGVELKTIPLDAAGRVSESTFVCSIDLDAAGDEIWEESRVWRKLRRVLWVPIEAAGATPLGQRRLGRAIYWEPSGGEARRLKADWTFLIGQIAIGGVEELDASLGEVLQVRPKAPNAAARTSAPGPDGGAIWTGPRGFYLRARFTEAVLWGLTEAEAED